jgi:hypothetical protein
MPISTGGPALVSITIVSLPWGAGLFLPPFWCIQTVLSCTQLVAAYVMHMG